MPSQMKVYFKKLYAYNAWANKKVLKCLKDQQISDPKTLGLLSHLVAALFIWLRRIKGQPPSELPLWGTFTLEELDSMISESASLWLEFIEGQEKFDRELSYTNYVGEPYTNNVEQIMIHLVNHSTYHRAQIALLIRQAGFEPVNTDFITYDRVVRGQLPD